MKKDKKTTIKQNLREFESEIESELIKFVANYKIINAVCRGTSPEENYRTYYFLTQKEISLELEDRISDLDLQLASRFRPDFQKSFDILAWKGSYSKAVEDYPFLGQSIWTRQKAKNI